MLLPVMLHHLVLGSAALPAFSGFESKPSSDIEIQLPFPLRTDFRFIWGFARHRLLYGSRDVVFLEAGSGKHGHRAPLQTILQLCLGSF